MGANAVEAKYYLHESDRKALEALRAIPGFHQLTRAFMKVWQERAFRIVNMSSYVRINGRQLGEYYDMLPPICERLGIEVPELYLQLDVNPNASTYGDTQPFIVMTSGLLETLPHELIPTVLAHECGHIACHHTLYTTMGSIVFGAASGALAGAVNSLPFGGLVTLPLEMAFAYWMRCSEFSADRAAVICDGTADRMSDVCMRLAGFDKDIASEANKQEFMAQAAEYREMTQDSKWDKTLEFMLFSGRSHPLMALRAPECEEWAAGDRFQSIVDGSYLDEDVPQPADAGDGDDSRPVDGDAARPADGDAARRADGEPWRFRFPKMPGRPTRPSMPWEAKEPRGDGGAEGGAPGQDVSSVADQIRQFKALMDEGLITPEEFEAKKRQLLGI